MNCFFENYNLSSIIVVETIIIEVSLVNKGYRFQLKPNKEQQEHIIQNCGCARFVYNQMLCLVEFAHDYGIYPSEFDSIKHIVNLKTSFPFLKDVESSSLQQAVKHLYQAYKAKKEPKFKSKRNSKQSYTMNNNNNNLSIIGKYVKLPKMGLVRIKQHRELPIGAKIKSATVSYESNGKFYISFTVEYEPIIVNTTIDKNNSIGLDFSMHELYVDSLGNAPKFPKPYRTAEQKLKREQRKLSHMVKDSSNYNKQRTKLARIHKKIANQRKDFLHKQSRQITNAYDIVCIEDLDMAAMRRALHFGKSVSDNGWGMFTQFLEYKLSDMGKKLIKIDRFYPSSQLCHCCGYQNPDVKNLSVREWTCPKCEAHHNRDTNAAINIQREGLRLLSA